MDELEFAAIQRAVIQRLEDFHRAGLTHWKRIEPAIAEPASADVSARPSAVPVKPSRLSEPSPATINPPPQVVSMPPKKAAVAPAAASNPLTFQPLDLPLEERVSRLASLCDQVKGCTRCQELATTRKQTVFGVGNPQAKIMFIGEAPGADEDQQGEPFVGRAGQLLNDIIKACRMKREDVYICNVLRCRPPGNRLPSPEEASNCREYLDGQIAIVNPEYIVCWGSTAAKNLLASESPIGKMRGKFFQYGRAKVVCTYHPSYLLRNPAAKKDVWDDMKFLFLEMGIDLSAK